MWEFLMGRKRAQVREALEASAKEVWVPGEPVLSMFEAFKAKRMRVVADSSYGGTTYTDTKTGVVLCVTGGGYREFSCNGLTQREAKWLFEACYNWYYTRYYPIMSKYTKRRETRYQNKARANLFKEYVK